MDLPPASFPRHLTKLSSAGGTAASTTALRHIELLERSGLIERRLNPRDNRVTLIRLSAKGRAAYLGAANWAVAIRSPAKDH